jgi:surfeit locus 1 family protein
MRFKVVPTIAYLVLVSGLLALGFWQLGRSVEKEKFLQVQSERLASESLSITSTTDDNMESLRYKSASIQGRYDSEHQILIDNQMNAGKVGYFVLTPFILADSKKAILVNRGWVPLNKDRRVLPDVKFKSEESIIKGRINGFPSVGLKLAGAEVPSKTWPAVVQIVDNQVLAKTIGYPLFQFQLELDKDQANGYVRDWQINLLMTPERHIAYAVQWFGLALTLTVLFVWYSLKK